MSVRAAFLDRSIGETRGVITLDGQPERLLIRRDSDPEWGRLGAQSIARAEGREGALQFMTMPDGGQAVWPFDRRTPLVRGALTRVVVTAEARQGKQTVVDIVGPGEGKTPSLLQPVPPIDQRIAGWAPGPVTTDKRAREVADEAQDLALQTVHPLPGGGDISIETTRALTAIDVDIGARRGGHVAANANLSAIAEGARLLRLKGLGGLVVFDLAGKGGHNGAVLAEAAKAAFNPDMPSVSIGPISRFGLFELALPWRWTPAVHQLRDESGRLSAPSAALALVRRLEDEARTHPGSRLTAACAPDVAAAAEPWLAELKDRIGARFTLETRPTLTRESIEVFVQ